MNETVLPPVHIRSDRDFAILLYHYPDSDEATEWFRFRVWASATKNAKAIWRIAAVQVYLDELAEDDHRKPT